MPASVTFEDKDKGMQRVIDEINTQGGFVDTGVQPDEGEELLIIAAANEFGTKNIPARPYIRGAIDSNEAEIQELAIRYSGEILDGKTSRYEALTFMGQFIEGLVKRYMVNLREPPNAPSTIKKKKSDNPLIDKSNLIGSIRYVVKEGKA